MWRVLLAMMRLLGLSAIVTLSLAEHAPLRIRADVAAAIAEGRPVVALESTIISHGVQCS